MDAKLMASCLAQTAGITPQSASRRMWAGDFRMSGPRVYRGNNQDPIEGARGQDFYTRLDPSEKKYGARLTYLLEDDDGQE